MADLDNVLSFHKILEKIENSEIFSVKKIEIENIEYIYFARPRVLFRVFYFVF